MSTQPGSQPGANETYLDHIGHWLPDVTAGADALRALGFTVTPFSEQRQVNPQTRVEEPAGAGNHCVMLEDGYLEFLTPLADTPIGLELKEGIARYVGVHIAAFANADAANVSERLANIGFAQRPVANLQRSIEQADGNVAHARFSVARPEVGTIPEGRVQFLTHHTPEFLWQSRYVEHANSAVALTGLVFAVTDLDEAVNRYRQIFDRHGDAIPGGQIFSLESGALVLLSDGGARDYFGVRNTPAAPAMIAYQISCRSIATFKSFADQAGIVATYHHSGQDEGQSREVMLDIELPSALGSRLLVTPEGLSITDALAVQLNNRR
jgi:hypothetical protein